MKKQLEAINQAAVAAVSKDVEANPELARDAQFQSAVTELKQRTTATDPAAAAAKTADSAAADQGAADVSQAPKPREVDTATGMGVWESVEVSEEHAEDEQREQERIEAKRQRIEVCSLVAYAWQACCAGMQGRIS